MNLFQRICKLGLLGVVFEKYNRLNTEIYHFCVLNSKTRP